MRTRLDNKPRTKWKRIFGDNITKFYKLKKKVQTKYHSTCVTSYKFTME